MGEGELENKENHMPLVICQSSTSVESAQINSKARTLCY